MTYRTKGEVRIPADIHSLWDHELATAKALANAGYVVEFLALPDQTHTKSPDILMNNVKWEIKSPKTDKLRAIEQNLKRASKQSENIIIDAQRLHRIQDRTVEAFLVQKYKQQKSIQRLLFINRHRAVIDITKLT